MKILIGIFTKAANIDKIIGIDCIWGGKMTDGYDFDESGTLLSETREEDNGRLKLGYILTVKKIFDEEWGIRESFTLVCRSGNDVAVLSDITSTRSRAEEIFRTFVENSVTPTSAFCVIEEMI